MVEKTQCVYIYGYRQLFQASIGGLETYPLWVRGNSCVTYDLNELKNCSFGVRTRANQGHSASSSQKKFAQVSFQSNQLCVFKKMVEIELISFIEFRMKFLLLLMKKTVYSMKNLFQLYSLTAKFLRKILEDLES